MKKNRQSSNSDKLILYFNGLGNGESRFREDLVLARASRRHRYLNFRMNTNWYSDEPYQDKLKRDVERVRAYLSYATLFLVGSSAGVSHGINVFRQTASETEAPGRSLSGLYFIGLCGRTAEGRLGRFDYRTLQRMAAKSPAFKQSVMYCEDVTLPSLTEEQKQHATFVYHALDEAVPTQIQTVEGAPSRRIHVPLHALGILRAGFLIPDIIEEQLAAQA